MRVRRYLYGIIDGAYMTSISRLPRFSHNLFIRKSIEDLVIANYRLHDWFGHTQSLSPLYST